MLHDVALKTLHDARRALAWWSLGLSALVALMVSVYPTVRSSPELNRMVQDYPEALKAFIAFGGQVDYVSAAGYLGSELFSFMVPLLLLVASIGAGARALAGEEEQGTLELLLANPISRRRLLLEKLAALVAETGLLALVLWLALLIGAHAAGMHVSGAHLAAATVSAGLLAVAFGAIALSTGACLGRRAIAIGAAAGGAVAASLVNSLAALVHFLEPLRALSPFYHYVASDPLRSGLEPGHVAFLVVLTLVAAAAGLAGFERRDISG